MKSLLFSIVLIIVFAGCASTEEKSREQRAEIRLTNFSNNLRTGMSFEEVSTVSDSLSDCRGSKESYMRCSAILSVESARYLPVVVGDLPANYKFHIRFLHV